ncbi:damage-control phosphatase ARMT1 family protein [Sediminispirochaeta smaragdinae]|uniref:Damage-control phosphatase ARMT1-like metal-binding domain-containing protein n=1 Tax=Sediminispirochaeta smaragdinae (strain DSM 11293 / JCM 15392 / SEBR 4228) TaxID=573413 RepID=E1RAY8_SEDSS|nr:ARMT1-like domain-containing protein [Sediminispirochaeta smaragdinae]ADK79518.1 protein of unknown function DUF89 [Sediminispirochaeta smaragdinae DSM 11293]
MRSYLDCFGCFMDQGLDVARRSGADEAQQRLILNEIARMFPSFDLETRPPVMSLNINQTIRNMTGVADPYADEKKRCNELALKAVGLVRDNIAAASDSLKRAMEYAIAGNSIDFGVNHHLDIDETLTDLINGEESKLASQSDSTFMLEAFRKELSNARSLLFISDNAGEIVFDMLLIEAIAALYPDISITVAVRDEPIINDATLEDAKAIGLNNVCEVISSGSPAPGTPLDLCSDEFLERFFSSDMVVAKGQGNYETLNDAPRMIYLLFRVKCRVISHHCGGAMGDIMLIPSQSIG